MAGIIRSPAELPAIKTFPLGHKRGEHPKNPKKRDLKYVERRNCLTRTRTNPSRRWVKRTREKRVTEINMEIQLKENERFSVASMNFGQFFRAAAEELFQPVSSIIAVL